MKPLSSMDRMILFLAVVGGISEGILAWLKYTSSESTIRWYIDFASIALVGVGAALLVLIIPRATRKSFRFITVLIALGFLFQLVYMFLWYNNFEILKRDSMPDVSIGDFFYLGSYVFWIAATIPYLRQYGNLMSSASKGMLATYLVLGAIAIYLSTHYWYDAAMADGYDGFATTVWLSYSVVPVVCFFFFLAIALLYHYDRYGKGLLRYYWLYFMIPIGLIAVADFMGNFYWIANGWSVAGQYSDAIYLLAYSLVIAVGATILGADLHEASMEASGPGRAKTQATDVVGGRGYIVEDPTAARSFELFAKMVSPRVGDGDRKGYVLSRQHPTQIRAKHELAGVPITWIASTVGESVIEPTKANMIAHTVMEFLSNAKSGVVLLDGLESVVVNNDFNRSVRMLEQINDFVMQFRGVLIVPIDPGAFDPREQAILMRNFSYIDATVSHVRDTLGGTPETIELPT